MAALGRRVIAGDPVSGLFPDPVRVAQEIGDCGAAARTARRVGRDAEDAVTAGRVVGDLPSRRAVIDHRMRLDVSAWEITAIEDKVGGQLFVADGRLVLVSAHQLTGAVVLASNAGWLPDRPIAVVDAIGDVVAAQVLRRRVRDDAQDVFLRADGHADVLVLPAGDRQVVDLRGVGAPRRRPGGLGDGGAHGRDGQRIAVRELVQRHVAGVVEHGLALGVVELAERSVVVVPVVGVRREILRRAGDGDCRHPFGGVVGPVDLTVPVVQTFDQHLEELFARSRVRVVVTDLLERDIHLVVERAGLDHLGAHLLGELGRRVGDVLDLHRAIGHLLVADDHGLGARHRVVHRHLDRAGRANPQIGIEHHRAAGTHRDRASSGDQALPLDGDVAAAELAASDRRLELRAGPAHVDTGIEVDAIVRAEVAADRQVAARVEQHAAIGQAGVERICTDRRQQAGGDAAVDRHHRRGQVHQQIGLDDRRVGRRRRDEVRGRHRQLGARLQEHVRVQPQAKDVAASQHIDVVGND